MTWPKKPTHLQTYLPKYPPLREAMASQKLDALPSFAFKLLVTYWAILFFRSSVFSFSTVSSVYKVYTVFACDSCDKYHVCQNWTKSYLTTVPKLVVTLSHSAVTTSVLVLMSGKSLAVQFTAVDKTQKLDTFQFLDPGREFVEMAMHCLEVALARIQIVCRIFE